MTRDCDVLVVGSGAGGATLASSCARAGKSVVLLERGRKYIVKDNAHDEQATLIDKGPYDDRPVEVNGTPRRLYVGGVLGGGTALYGAALLRPSRDDFHPGKHYGQRIPHAIWDWPVSYDDLEPYYTEAEKLYGVSGNAGEDFGPLQQPAGGYAHLTLPLHPVNEKLMAANRAHGLRPFHLPLAIDATTCLRCGSCAGYVCPNGSRRSSGQLVEQAVAAGLPLRLHTNAEAERLHLDGAGQVVGVEVLDRSTGKRTVYRAGRYVLAAGAIATPLLLLRSGIEGPLIGRNYMVHLSPVVAGVFTRPTGADVTFAKQVGFADYYLGAKGYEHKMGLVQSLPVPGPLLTAKTAPRWLPRRLLGLLRRRMLPLAGIVEDLPDPNNRIYPGPGGSPRMSHRFGEYDLERGRHLTRLMKQILSRAGARFSVAKRFASDEHVAHQCGTLRFGRDAAHAVLGPDCRLFGKPNVFVVDGSFLPTSLGVGPALTLMANALRVADIVTREL
jgi:choline dehydrogenase-like flavoprotein